MASHEIDEEQATQIKFRFCKGCSNLLYPLEDSAASQLLFRCKHCERTEVAESACVFRNELSNTVGETAGITQDVGMDPTVGNDLAVPPMCTMCGEEIVCETCGEAMEDGYMCLEVGGQEEEKTQKETDNSMDVEEDVDLEEEEEEDP